MRLMDCEIRPGSVLAVCNNYGTVKATCLGLFSEEDDVDNLPPIVPFLKTSNTAFSEPQIGDMLWIIINHDNPQELFYVFQGDAVLNNDDTLEAGYDDCEILSKRNEGNSLLMWSDTEGWTMKQDSSQIQIDPDNNIKLSREDDSESIKIDKSGIHLDTGGDSNPAVLGNELKGTIQEIINLLSKTAAALSASPAYSAGGVLSSGLPLVSTKLAKILSKKVTLD